MVYKTTKFRLYKSLKLTNRKYEIKSKTMNG